MFVPSAGRLNTRLTLQQRSTTQDASGGQSTTWSDVATVWAFVRPLSGREIIAAQAVNSELTHQITIRWQAAYASPKAMAAMRLVAGGRIFNIQSAANEREENRYLVMMATEGLNDG